MADTVDALFEYPADCSPLEKAALDLDRILNSDDDSLILAELEKFVGLLQRQMSLSQAQVDLRAEIQARRKTCAERGLLDPWDREAIYISLGAAFPELFPDKEEL